ncbi:MAG: OsmC family protein [Bryobacteraceae bacterium]
MQGHAVSIEWERRGSAFLDHRYSRAHRWRFDGGAEVAASSSPHIVRVPFSDPAAVDPEEAFVASLSSCHMLWFLDLAARAGFIVDRYADRAEGYLTKRSDGKMWLSRLVLFPEVHFVGVDTPTDEMVHNLHHQAHEECYLANAVKTEIEIKGKWTHSAAT